MSITVPVTIEKKKIAQLLACATESGSKYWVNVVGFAIPEGVIERFADDVRVYRYIDFPLNVGGAVHIASSLDPGLGHKVLDLAALASGLSTMAALYPRHFADFLAGEEDATTGDVFLQCCLYGTVLFG